MDNQGIKKGALLDSKNLCYRCRIQGIGRQSVNGFGRDSDRFSAADAYASSLNRIRIVGCKNFGLHRLNRLSRKQIVSIQNRKRKLVLPHRPTMRPAAERSALQRFGCRETSANVV